MEGLPDHPVRRPRRAARTGCELLTLPPRRIVLLRHGQTGYNATGRIQGQLDVDLDDVGRAQAVAAGRALAALQPAVVVSSDLARARVTAEAVGLPVRLDARLRELHLGAWQGLTSAEAAERFPEEHEAWRAGVDVPRGGGETYAQAGERAAACVLEALPDEGTLVAVTHGGTARGAVAALLGLPTSDWLSPLGNTRWSVLVEARRGWRLEKHDVGAAAGADPVR